MPLNTFIILCKRGAHASTITLSSCPAETLSPVCVLAIQSYRTLCNHMGYSPLGFSIQVIFQARILEWVAIPFPKGSS